MHNMKITKSKPVLLNSGQGAARAKWRGGFFASRHRQFVNRSNGVFIWQNFSLPPSTIDNTDPNSKHSCSSVRFEWQLIRSKFGVFRMKLYIPVKICMKPTSNFVTRTSHLNKNVWNLDQCYQWWMVEGWNSAI